MPSFSFTLPQKTDFSGVFSDKYALNAFKHALVFKKRLQAYLLGTDGRILAIAPVDEGSSPFVEVLPALAGGKPFLKAGRDGVQVSYAGPSTAGKKASVAVQQGNKQSVYEVDPPAGPYPDVKAVLPDDKALGGCVQLTLDVNKLVALAKAISDDGRVTLFVPTAKKDVEEGVPVVGHGEELRPKGIGLIMPIMPMTNKNDLKGFFLGVVDSVPSKAEVSAALSDLQGD